MKTKNQDTWINAGKYSVVVCKTNNGILVKVLKNLAKNIYEETGKSITILN